MEKLVLTEAARRLGISEEALRKRITRGKVASEKDSEGHVYVLLDGSEAPESAGKPALETAPRAPESLQQELDRLWQQINKLTQDLERERTARAEEQRRHDHIIMAMVTKMPALKAGLSPEDTAKLTVAADSTVINTTEATSETAAPLETPTSPPPASAPPAPKRPWWKRFGRKQ
jgi:hypothetical protein